MGKKLCIAIQARMSSTRLPGKVLKKVKGKSIISTIVDNVALLVNKADIYVLTSQETSDDQLYDYLKNKGVNVFRGELENVLERYQSFALSIKDNYEYIGRVCADSPFLDLEILKIVNSNISGEDLVTTRYVKNGVIFSNVTKGNNYDVIKVTTLLDVDVHAQNEFNQEHVVPTFLFQNYNVNSVNDAYFAQLSNEDRAIDTLDDYMRLK